MIRDKLVDFIIQMMNLFERKKIIYKRLIILYHAVHNKLSDAQLEYKIRNIIDSNDLNVKIKRRDTNFLIGTEFEIDNELISSELNAVNKRIIWEWLDSLLAELNY